MRAPRWWRPRSGAVLLVDDGVTGYLVDSRDPADYTAPIARLLDDRGTAGAMGAAPRAGVSALRVEYTTRGRLRRSYADLCAASRCHVADPDDADAAPRRMR